MALLTDYTWETKYDSDTLSLIKNFYEPALNCAVRYNRSTGYFSARILTLASRGIEGLIRNHGIMRLVIGCTLKEPETAAIERGEKLRDVVENSLINLPFNPENMEEADTLELLSWMIAKGFLEVKLALPCSPTRQPIPVGGIFHEKAGIIEDKAGNRLAFNGSVNETAYGWTRNWESFHAFTDWGGTRTYVDDEEAGFAKLWTNKAKRCLVIDVPTAVKEQLLKFLPPNDKKPKRLLLIEELEINDQDLSNNSNDTSSNTKPDTNQIVELQEQFKQIWNIIQNGAAIPGEGDRVGEATSAITPYPHQIKAFQRLYQNYPPKLLLCDEVGLGKTIQAGLLIRQAWLSGKAKRILILAPKAVLTQWQEDEFVSLTPAERQVYEAVEDYISTTYDNASQAEKNAVGFVMTIYRRRLASSFAALAKTLNQRFITLKNRNSQLELNEENISDDETSDETMDVEQANKLETEALQAEEVRELEFLLKQVQKLPVDTKAQILRQQLQRIKQQGYKQIIIFTQYTDTMDFLRQYLVEKETHEQYKVICFSGRGGEIAVNNDSWRLISRDETKQMFRQGKADILLCTDAAAEGLNFQFCGALINYDMPWNPMRVEQRIGRIDRLGQEYENIKIINLHYENTVEADVYLALRERIGLFSQYVGRLQPILATLPRSIANAALSSHAQQEQQRATLVNELDNSIRQAQEDSFDLDAITEADLEEPPRPEALYDLKTLDNLLRNPSLLPPGIEVQLMQDGEYKYSMPGMKNSLRITTKPDYFDQHPGSTELWSPGSPLFPVVDGI